MGDPEPSSSLQIVSAVEKNSQKISLLGAVRSWLRHALGTKHDGSLKEALEEVIEEHEGDSDDKLEAEERVMLHNVLSFAETKVSEIMIPRTDISAVNLNVTLEEIKSHILEQKHTRIPVYDETLDQMLGFVHVKDMLPIIGGEAEFNIRAVLREVLFVPPSMRIMDLLVKMRSAGSHLAIVVDEYGGTDGLITMEDLFEEIVGDIQDEHDDEEEQEDKINHIGSGVFEVNARIRIEKLEKELGLSLVSEGDNEFDTLGGFIFFQLGRVPVKGEMVAHPSGISFNIIDADARSIKKVRIVSSRAA